MIVYRITTAKWANKLTASGYPARWNPRHVKVIYTASSTALACLENLVHRSGEGFNANFRLIEIAIPDKLRFDSITVDELPENWHKPEGYPVCREFGKEWVDQDKTCILKVPSSIIPDETNILINPGHPGFGQITIKSIQPFSFDERLSGG